MRLLNTPVLISSASIEGQTETIDGLSVTHEGSGGDAQVSLFSLKTNPNELVIQTLGVIPVGYSHQPDDSSNELSLFYGSVLDQATNLVSVRTDVDVANDDWTMIISRIEMRNREKKKTGKWTFTKSKVRDDLV